MIARDINVSSYMDSNYIHNNSKHIPLPMLAQNVDQTKPNHQKGVAQYKTVNVNGHKLHFIQRNLYIKDKSIATINCTDIDHPLKEIEYLLVNKLCDILEEGLSEGCIWNDNTITETGLLFQKLLDDKPIKIDSILLQFNNLNLPKKSYFTCLCLRVLDSESGIILLKFLKANIQYYLSNAFITSKNNDIVIFIYTPNRTHIHNTVDEFKNLLNGCVYQIGVSNTFCDIENSKLYYYQACASIDVQKKSNYAIQESFYFKSLIMHQIHLT